MPPDVARRGRTEGTHRVHVIHQLKFARRCPVNNGFDIYELRVETGELLKVEDILAAVEALPEREFQETLTKQLAQALKAVVTTVGEHSGVRTTCFASPS
jgi:hypothetical protein